MGDEQVIEAALQVRLTEVDTEVEVDMDEIEIVLHILVHIKTTQSSQTEALLIFSKMLSEIREVIQPICLTTQQKTFVDSGTITIEHFIM